MRSLSLYLMAKSWLVAVACHVTVLKLLSVGQYRTKWPCCWPELVDLHDLALAGLHVLQVKFVSNLQGGIFLDW